MTGISWMLQEAAQCPVDDYLVYDDHLGEEELASGELDSVEYEYSYDVKSEKVCIDVELQNKIRLKTQVIVSMEKNCFVETRL